MPDLVALPGAGDWLLLFLAPMVVGGLWWIHRRYSAPVRWLAAWAVFLVASLISGFAWGGLVEKLVLGAVHWVLWLKSATWTAVAIGMLAYILRLLAEEVDDEEM